MPAVLITGANRGIGLELAKAYAARGDTVICASRDSTKVPEIEGNIHRVKIDSDSLTDARDVATKLKTDGINVDLVIANAGIQPSNAPFAEIDPMELQKAFTTNVQGVLVLFQAMKDVLSPGGKFIVISSGFGLIHEKMRPGAGAYGLSKCAVNFLVRKLHVENSELFIMSFNPGWVRTEMGDSAARFYGMDEAPEDITITIPSMIKIIDEGKKEKYGGWMANWDGDLRIF